MDKLVRGLLALGQLLLVAVMAVLGFATTLLIIGLWLAATLGPLVWIWLWLFG